MTDKQRAMHIGRIEALKSVTIGLAVSQLIMMSIYYRRGLVDSFLWFNDFSYKINLVVAIAAIYFCAYIFGGIAGINILIRRRNYVWTGFLYGMIIMITTTFLASCTVFFQEGLDGLDCYGCAFFDYIFKPLFWVAVTGSLPVVVLGCWFGSGIHKKGERN